ncbi:kiwellin-1-like [Punica granatum]|uniref:Uncharacterized protein n=2 Tax=Punica granatum TaxID=22663 RepID=A0A218XT55_PUNGR|nr:kiwellin-1-like [Punica granatum]OWM88217.1 hypothetical protein CDL15_Pgr003629 [Punica granatum]PKI45427.1 hypothetical protein CRG98_034232 [Punica granatum]
MKNTGFKVIALTLLALVAAQWLGSEAQSCQLSGQFRGRKAPLDQCNTISDSECCKEGRMYPVDKHSPAVSSHTKAILTINSFQKGGSGGGPSECDGQYHSDSTRIVALSTGWFNHRSRCHRNIIIKGNGRSVRAMVVDECDSNRGCANNIVDASRAVWEALGVQPNSNKWGRMDVTWSDA